MKELKLTHGLTTVVDDIDYEWAKEYKWCAVKGIRNKTWYAVRGVRLRGKCIHLYLHRLIVGALKGKTVVFKDGDSLNNCRSNLSIKRGINRYRNGGYEGVSLYKPNGMWIAKGIGFFPTAWEASLAYRKGKV